MPFGFIALMWAGLMGVAPAWGALEIVYGHEAFWRVLVYGVPAAMIVYGTLQAKVGESVWTYLGNASYSLYLTQLLPLSALYVLWRIHPIPPDLIVLIGLAAALLFAWRVHERVEKPIMTLGAQFGRRMLEVCRETTTRIPLSSKDASAEWVQEQAPRSEAPYSGQLGL